MQFFALAAVEKINLSYISRILRMEFLSPVLVQISFLRLTSSLADYEGPSGALTNGMETTGEKALGSIPAGCFKGDSQCGQKYCFRFIITDANMHLCDVSKLGVTN